ncbi:ABC transporter substrate-binding protein [Candidatus Ruthia endofausta]|uniref:ABC transporter substrate-binding protein n=1 Tax=Candidatus Ruthia endofausta TaxID=2738852 RepID=A0A6N0HP74_9GAMM|nr:ABC transporter substrate-binding protein [Candidatus Ruthia endofausta]QKQ24134.1 ABC transporter substrate-binding protein [Candidatus Ruthia endofausta]
MRRLNVILLALMMFTSLSAFAERVAQDNGPVQAIQIAIVKLNQLATMAYSPKMLNFFVEKEIAPLFDFNYIASEVLLVSNNRLGEEETKFFVNRLKNNMMSTLLARLSQVNSTSFQFISARPMIDSSIAVQLKVNGYTSFSGIYLDLLFHQNEDKQWQIFDIVLNNDSLINYYQKMVLIKVRRYGIYGMLGRL